MITEDISYLYDNPELTDALVEIMHENPSQWGKETHGEEISDRTKN